MHPIKPHIHSLRRLGARVIFSTALGLVGLAAGLIGCDQSSAPTSDPVVSAPPTAKQVQDALVAEQSALNELTRGLAMALANPDLREQVKEDLIETPFTHEHKLEFGKYLSRHAGHDLADAIAAALGKRRNEVLALVKAIRPLEFYMPVSAHRDIWTGDSDLLVAGMLDEKPDVAATLYNLKGDRVPLAPGVTPDTPSLALVPVETDFAKPLDKSKAHNRQKQAGTVGTYVVTQCDPETGDGCGGGGGGYGYTMYNTRAVGRTEVLSQMRLTNDNEPWYKGAPEIHLRYMAATSTTGVGRVITEYIVPEYLWAGSDDDANAHWRGMENASMFYWDSSYGEIVHLVVFEDDGGTTFSTELNLGTKFAGQTVAYKVTYTYKDDDDPMGEIDLNINSPIGDNYPFGTGSAFFIDKTR